MHLMRLLPGLETGLFAMEDLTAIDAALDAGYYQGHLEALPLIVLAITLLSLLHWALQNSPKER